MRVGLTGEWGFLGTNLRRWLIDKGYRVTSSGLSSFRAEDDLGFTPDVRKPEEIGQFVLRSDVIIHLAARKGSWFCEADEQATVDTNMLGTIRVAMACIKHNKPLMHFGTTAYYRPVEPWRLLDENADLFPSTLYGLTKLAGERSLYPLEDLRFMVVRPVYGYGNIGPHAASRSESWMDVVLRGFARGRREPLQTDMGEHFVKQYTHVVDIVDATTRLLDVFMAGGIPRGEVIQVGYPTMSTFGELMAAFDLPFKVLYDEARDYKRNQVHTYQKLESYLDGWRAKIDPLEYAFTRGTILSGVTI